MSVRFLANAGRIIMSKAGYDASPSLPDQFKLFDSNWMATGLVIAAGSVTKQARVDVTVPFPYPLHYQPAAYAYTASSDAGVIGQPVRGYTTKNELVLYQNFNNSVEIRYVIFAVSI